MVPRRRGGGRRMLAALIAAGYSADELSRITDTADWASLLRAQAVPPTQSRAVTGADLLASEILAGAIPTGPLDEWLSRWLDLQGIRTFC